MKFALTIIASIFLSSTLHADDNRGTLEEAKSMALDATAHIKAVGKEKAFSDFHDKKSRFFKKDLYVFVQDLDCAFLAHGLNPKLVGRNIWNLKNPNGRYACQDIVNGLKEKNAVWTDYIFKDPLTNNLAWKRTYSIKYNGMVINVGAYNPQQKDIK
jgi:signal transduction histidine kinase